MKALFLATGNPGKLRELTGLLQGLAWQLHPKPEALELAETGTTFTENADLKASQLARAQGAWAIADDSGLEVVALGGDPGVYSARYGTTDQERIERLLGALGDNPQRRARFVCVVSLANPQGEVVHRGEGVCEGEVLPVPRGQGGFGYDPVFYVPAWGLTYAEMPPDLKQRISHRGQALAQVLPYLRAWA